MGRRESIIRDSRRLSKPSHDGYRKYHRAPRRGTTREQRGTSLIRHHSVGAKRMLIPRTSGKNALAFILIFPNDQASNWLERLPARSISTWKDLTTRFLAQFFPPGRAAKL
ncbi:zinc finger, CCHC-type containing protein [Tanacetum coccineum]